jgi:hypothetical protein
VDGVTLTRGRRSRFQMAEAVTGPVPCGCPIAGTAPGSSGKPAARGHLPISRGDRMAFIERPISVLNAVFTQALVAAHITN